ncbi:hypothetical protein BU24DRAFT_450409 [Aaosphaeria arxii CBS 175.79]|uniref:Uncharacterized protein n=1 Tax=Aaosphaeria arxii CBS 175.79 TaxID=1450172 RepID=A0A6A5XS26_9PLEO|nr:uncharacterized protein BU24DRAFT_450409 [Aaosphaeria arxii CBS 175.79]KAF2015743.1 hypothetical protein BU24DRAFT_450409 [Aaosphaeria arxii CBS 175.79]
MNAWEVAVQKHLASLPPGERAAFQAPASVEDCMTKVHMVRHRHRQKYHKLLETLRPIIEPLERFQGAIDVIAQVQSGMIAPVWGPLRAVITLASDRITTLQTLTRLLERLVEPLKRFQTYENIFSGNPALQAAIGALYSDLIDFCTRAVRFFGKRSVRTIFGSFDKDFREVSENIRHHWTEIDIAANFVHITQSSALRTAENDRRQAQLRGDMQRWLFPASIADDLNRCAAECVEGSCKWFQDSDHYNMLTSVYDSYAIRIVGRPGEGKTTLSAWVMQKFQRMDSMRVLCFFCKAGDAQKRLAVHVIRTLLSQLLQLHDDGYNQLEKWYQNSGRPIAESFTELCAAFLDLLPRIGKQPLCIIIDAIDECTEPQELIKILQKCKYLAPGPVHMILTSRDYPNLRSLFDFVDAQITFPVHFTEVAIRSYVANRVAGLDFAQAKGLREEVIAEVSQAADGLWLYARLALDEISQASGRSEVRRLLSSLPKDLISLYSSIIRSSEARFSESQIRIAQEIFIWIDGADYMPWWHFHSNDILEDSALTVLITFANGEEEVFDPMTLIQRLCFPLVDVFYKTIDGERCPFAASFVHYSAEQYLKWTSDIDSNQLPRILGHRKLRKLYRGVTSAWYFTESNDFKHVLSELREDPYGNGVGAYFEMAYGMGDSWHAASLPENLDEDDKRIVEELCKPLVRYIQTTECIGWAEAAILINYAGGFTNLLENVQKAIDILEDSDSGKYIAGWHEYVQARRLFFVDFGYILKITGPGYKSWDRTTAVMPDGFEDREVATAILALGRKYQHYVDEAPTVTNLSGETISEQTTSSSREWNRRSSSQDKQSNMS